MTDIHDRHEHDGHHDGVSSLLELAAGRSIGGLDGDEARRLDSALAGGGIDAAEVEALEALAARVAVAMAAAEAPEVPPMPRSLRERLVADAVRVSHGRPAGGPRVGDGPVRRDPARTAAFEAGLAEPPTDAVDAADAPRPFVAVDAPASSPASIAAAATVELAPWRRSLAWAGWAVAAAIVGFLLLVPPPSPPRAEPPSGPMTVARLMALDAEAIEIPLAGLPDVADGVTGRIVWSDRQQTGVLQVRGLPANDRQQVQYQLWVFDRGREERSEQHPAVDGGVFDVAAGAAELEIPIEAKLAVFDPYLFAITSEPPGGVVKHDPALDPERFRILATAAVPG
ncbi:MAG: hypothetical protein ACYTEV_03090 [Planctomycetota bacterium]|jgi:hypothetical protein